MSEIDTDPTASFPEDLRAFVDREPWTFAKTYAETWPHEYLVRDRVACQELFEQLVEYIRTYGYRADFYSRKITYFDEGGLTYWTMGAPVEETTIINRCAKENTYEERKKAETLPV